MVNQVSLVAVLMLVGVATAVGPTAFQTCMSEVFEDAGWESYEVLQNETLPKYNLSDEAQLQLEDSFDFHLNRLRLSLKKSTLKAEIGVQSCLVRGSTKREVCLQKNQNNFNLSVKKEVSIYNSKFCKVVTSLLTKKGERAPKICGNTYFFPSFVAIELRTNTCFYRK